VRDNFNGGKSVYQLIDTHAHLEEIENLKQAIAEAKSASIIAIIGVGSDYESNQKVLDFAQVYKDFVYPAMGWHPWNLKGSEIDRNLEFIEAHPQTTRVDKCFILLSMLGCVVKSSINLSPVPSRTSFWRSSMSSS